MQSATDSPKTQTSKFWRGLRPDGIRLSRTGQYFNSKPLISYLVFWVLLVAAEFANVHAYHSVE
jgi:hypothetical protein